MPNKEVEIVVGQDYLPWDIGKAIIALRSIGYTFEQAIADIVDNCIDAKASNVLVRFIVKRNGFLSIFIVDDGCGMNATILKEAMRIGSGTNPKGHHLGKYGLGLKLATFSHAKCLTVHTKKGGEVNGRRLTVDGIKKNGLCDRIAVTECNRIFGTIERPFDVSTHGTVVIWDQVDRITYETSNLEKLIKKLRKKLQLHLGMCFHRQIQAGNIKIMHDRQDESSPSNDMAVKVKALDPFAYSNTGHVDYPKRMTVILPKIGELDAEAHIWPSNSVQPEYKLDGASAKQGFYFYRNDRLIQAGGWNGWRETLDPHLSLARVRINLSSTLDSQFSLDVKKCGIRTPAVFPIALQSAVFDDETRFDDYLRTADKVYRQKPGNGGSDFPLIPSSGIPRKVRNAFRTVLPEEGGSRDVVISWRRLAPDVFFEIDRDNEELLINKRFRHQVLRGYSGSKNDAPILKSLLFLLVQKDFDSQRVTKKRKRQLELINDILIAATDCLED